jgi:ABC-2 type transport system permease protein
VSPAVLSCEAGVPRRRRFMRDLLACGRLDLAEALRSRWFVFCAAVDLALVAVFLLAGSRESALFGFTGVDRALFAFAHALLVILPLLALLATGQVVTRAREEGSLELVLGHGASRGAWLIAVATSRVLVLFAPLVILVGGAALWGHLAHGSMPWSFVGRILLVCGALIVAFAGAGLAISTFARSGSRALVATLLAWALAAALLDLGLVGLLLRGPIPPEITLVLASLNPVEAARLGLLAGVNDELAALGPVGFWVATRVGESAMLALGTIWPAAFGLAALAAGLRRFCKGDVT